MHRVRPALLVLLAATAACASDISDVVESDGEPSADNQIDPGESLRATVNRAPAGAVFVIKAGVHRRQSVVPKDGMQFLGEPGAVLDGENVTPHAFETLRAAPRDVVIRGLVIERYAPPSQRGAIQGDNGVNWVIEDNEIRNNANTGVRIGKQTLLRNNHIHHNDVVGVSGYRADDAIVEANEIAHNSARRAAESGAGGEASGMKFVATYRLTLRANRVHDNHAKGIWTDHALPGILIEGNTLTDNGGPGIWHEASYDAVIRHNVVERNGLPTRPRWLESAGIQVTSARDVEIYGNTVRDNANGIGVMQAAGYAAGPHGPKVVENLHVHDNTVHMSRGRTGLAQNLGDRAYYTSKNNRFSGNSYFLGSNRTYCLFDERNLTEAGWQAAGNDVIGTFMR